MYAILHRNSLVAVDRSDFTRLPVVLNCCLKYEGCSFSNARWSIKQEVATVRFTYNVNTPSKYSPPLHTHSPSRLRQDSKTF